jgi:hypothetical protein
LNVGKFIKQWMEWRFSAVLFCSVLLPHALAQVQRPNQTSA